MVSRGDSVYGGGERKRPPGKKGVCPDEERGPRQKIKYHEF